MKLEVEHEKKKVSAKLLSNNSIRDEAEDEWNFAHFVRGIIAT